MSNIQSFYDRKCVLITGGSGFLGKILTYRLLVSCPHIQRVYLLIRPTQKHSAQERLASILNSSIFQNVGPERYEKVLAVSGDLIGQDLGIRQEDLELIYQTVAVVFHTAATVKFDEPLKTSVEVNVCGTAKLLQLCRHMKQLRAFIHVSTAYSNCHKKKIEELVYDPVVEPDQLIEAFQWMNGEMIYSVTSSLIPPWPNTYTYTKALAEAVIVRANASFPVGIVRPSIIGSALNHPCAGYIDNFNGPSGLLAAIGKGALRTMLGDIYAVADIVPVDLVADLLITAAWHLACSQNSEVVPVFNFVSGPVNPMTWGFVQTSTLSYYLKNPVEKLYRVPSAQFTQSRLIHEFWRWTDHLIPAYIIDGISKMQSKNSSVVKSYEKLHRATACLDFFTQQSWEFESKNVIALWKSLDQRDRQIVNFDVSAINWKLYMEKFCMGVKVFLLHEELQNLPEARRNLSRRKNIAHAVTTVLCILFWIVIGKNFRLIRSSWVATLSIAFRLFMLLSKINTTKD
ncbi:fatty acyl-CoA reductase 1-like [Paramacrobiotus metropolitanus]|uniref:fatty acyl-CoA reductase 1-like n=1 Tax=Paramacrobiotus metropolitanus TaxID=2943436 RepID=UPI002446529D|nr:fatty acyl-CoA reductase 1-like [Paramacrobiotus metropolitanus]